MGDKVLLTQLKTLLVTTWEIEEAVKNYGPHTQPALAERMTQFISSVGQLRHHTAQLEGVQIPEDMLQYMDDGGNPNQYTAEVFQACVRDNQASKGKIEAVQCLWDLVLEGMDADAPERAAAYRQMLAQKGRVVKPSQVPVQPGPGSAGHL